MKEGRFNFHAHITWGIPLLITACLFVLSSFLPDNQFFSVNLALIVGILSYFAAEWTTFKKEIKTSLSFKSKIALMLDPYTEANMLMSTLTDTFLEDLELDNRIRKDKDNEEFHIYLSRRKYTHFFKSYFVFSSEEKVVSKIPKIYFPDIWDFLIDRSDCYHSLQLLTEGARIYIEDEERQRKEINFLDGNLKESKKKSKLEKFEKVFVLDDSHVDSSTDIITNEEIRDYLSVWNDGLKGNKKATLKLIKRTEAIGHLSRINELKDIGIFGNILGEQSIVPKETCIYEEPLIFSFTLDTQTVNSYKNSYRKIFERAKDISAFFKD